METLYGTTQEEEDWRNRRTEVIAAFAVARHYREAEKLSPGMTILERTERGTVKTRAIVLKKYPCLTDRGNVHVDVSVNGKTHTWCYLGAAQVEYDA